MSRDTPDGFRSGGPHKHDDVTEDWDDDESDPADTGWPYDDWDDDDDEPNDVFYPYYETD